MVEFREERDRYIENPLRLLRCGVELGGMAVRSSILRVAEKVGEALEIEDSEAYRDAQVYSRIYPTEVEAPVATEEELDLQYKLW